MPNNPFSKLKRWLFKGKQQYDVGSIDGDQAELRRSTSEQSIASSEGSCQGADDDVFDSDLNIPGKSRSEGALHKLTRKIRNYKRRNSQTDSPLQKHETFRRYKSETEIVCKQKKRCRSRSFVRDFLCVIPEARDLDSDSDIKHAQNTNVFNSRTSLCESSSFRYLTGVPDDNLKKDPNTRYDEEKRSIPTTADRTESKQNVEESIPVSSLLSAVKKTARDTNKCRSVWEAEGARPKDVSTKINSAASSGISSMESCLVQQSEEPSVEDYVESTLQYTRDRHSASSPGEMHEIEGETSQLNRKWKSCNNIKSSNVQLNIFNGGASTSNVNSTPIQAVNPMSPVDKMDALKAMTDVVMKTFSTEEKVAKRSAFEKGISALTSSDKSRIAVIVGHKGDGKTVCGKHMLQELHGFKHKLLVNSFKEWQTVKIKDKAIPDTAIFIDDMFGTDRFRKSIYDKWQPFLDQIYAASTNGNVSAIISIDKKVFERYLTHNSCHSLFSKDHVIDLTGEFSLKREEKCSVLKEHLRHFNKAKKVTFCGDKVDDNTAEFVENGDLYIWEDTIEQISILSYPVGFPTAAVAFASAIENIKQGVEYFYSPQNSIVVSINEIRRSQEPSQRKAALAIGTIIQRGGQMALSEFEAEENQLDSRTRSSKEIKKGQGRLPLKDALRGRVPANEPITVYFREGLSEIKGNYVDIEDDTITFRCVPIHYSAAISFGKGYAVDVIAVMPFDFISKFVRPPRAYNERQSLYISLDPATYAVLFDRLLKEIERKNVRMAMEHQYIGEKTFVAAFLKYISSECKMKRFLQMRDSVTNLNVLCHGMTRNYQKNPDYANCTEHILKTEWKEHMKRSGKKEFFEKEAVKIAAHQRNVSSFEELVKRMKTFDTKCFDAVIQSGSKQLLDILLKYKDYHIDLLTAIKSTYQYHFKNDHKKATQFAKYLLLKETSLMRKKAMREAKEFASDCNDNDLLEFLASVERD